MRRAAGHIHVVILAYAEDLLDLWNGVAHIGVIYLVRVQFLHFFFRDKTTLMAEPLFSQVLTTIVSYFFLGATQVLLKPVLADFQQEHCVFSHGWGQRSRLWTRGKRRMRGLDLW